MMIGFIDLRVQFFGQMRFQFDIGKQYLISPWVDKNTFILKKASCKVKLMINLAKRQHMACTQ